MQRSKLILAALALIVTSPALAQSGCGGQFGAGKFCGNPNGATGLPGPVALTPGVLAPIAGGTVIGNPTGATAAPIDTTAPVLGIPGASTGQVGLAGATSGTSILRAQAAAGTAVSLLPTASGTLVSTSASPVAIDLVTGRLSITGLTGGVLAGAVPAFTRTPVFGVPGSAVGTLGLAGNTSGTVTITPQAVAGTTTLTLPNTSGTFAVGATSPLVLSTTTGGLTCPTCVTSSGGGGITGVAPIVVSGAGAVSITGSALTKTDDTNVTVTLGGTPGSALVAPASLTLGWAGQLSVPRGGTGLASGTSGGIPYFNSGTTMASSAALAANQLVLGGGAGAAPATLGSLGSAARQMLQSGTGAPAWSTATWPDTTTINQILYSNIANTVSGLATANNGVLITSGAGVPSISSTLPSGIAATNMVLTAPSLGVATATSINGNTLTTGTWTVTGAAAKVLTFSNSLTFAGTDGTTMTFPGTSATVASLNLQGQTLSGGATVTSLSVAAGSFTVNCGNRPLQFVTGATSAWSITAPAADGSCMILLTNAASTPVIPTFSGFTVGSNTGSTLTTTASSKFTIQVWRINGTSGYTIFAHQ